MGIVGPFPNDNRQDTMSFTYCQLVKTADVATLRHPTAMNTAVRSTRRRQDGKPLKCRACRLAPCISTREILDVTQSQWNTQAVVREHRAHTTFMPVCRQAMHEVPCLSA
jgi:hypothetical protein